MKGDLAPSIIQLLEAVEAVARVAHHLAGLADVAELLGKFQQANFGPNDLLLFRHRRCPLERRGRALRTPTTPRPASASPQPMTPSVRLSVNYYIVALAQVETELRQYEPRSETHSRRFRQRGWLSAAEQHQARTPALSNSAQSDTCPSEA